MVIPTLTTAQLERVIASLHGLRIIGVDYALLTGGTDGHEALDWDYGSCHEPTTGIQLSTDTGDVVTLTWGSSFGCYSLEAHHRSIGDFLAHIGQPSGPLVLPVGEHPRGGPCSAARSSAPNWRGSNGPPPTRRHAGIVWMSRLRAKFRRATRNPYGSVPVGGSATGLPSRPTMSRSSSTARRLPARGHDRFLSAPRARPARNGWSLTAPAVIITR